MVKINDIDFSDIYITPEKVAYIPDNLTENGLQIFVASDFEDFYKLVENIKLPNWKDRAIYITILFVSIFALTAKNFSVPAGIDIYPVKEVEFVKINNLKGNILTNFGYGSYVSYKLYPHNLIFMDGRYEEVYDDYMVPALKEFFLGYPNWDFVLKNFPPDVMILEKMYPIYNKLKDSNNWKVVYEGKNFGVFLPRKNADKKFIQPSNDINYYKNTLFNTDINFKL